MSKLRIFFADLIAFVQNADGSYWVLLPEARLPSKASDGSPIEAHHPVVLFDLGDQGTSDWPNVHKVLKLNGTPTNNEAWQLGRRELQILVAPSLPVSAPGTATSGLPTVANRTDFTWVPDLAAMGIEAKVHPDCFLPVGPPPAGGRLPSAKITARLRLTAGTLTTFQFVRFEEPSVTKRLWIPALEFKDLGGSTTSGLKRACADLVVAEIPLSAPSVVTVTAVSLDDGTTARTHSFSVTEASDDIDLLVGNLAPEPPWPPPPMGLHFERCYDILQATPPSRPIPHVVAGFPAASGSSVDPGGINGNLPSFIARALQVPFSGFNGPICSMVKLQS
jgi:hypothetical protein